MRAGFTLLEILLVLAIMIVILALAFPSFEQSYAEYRVSAAADQVRGAWQTARSEAMEKSVAYRFSIVPGQGNFRIAPDTGDYWNGGETPSTGDPNTQPIVLEDVLPGGVRFSTLDSLEQGLDSSEAAVPAGSVGSDRWQPTAVFLPDGTAEEDVEIVFHLSYARPLVLRLRSLTGVISSQVLSPQGGLP